MPGLPGMTFKQKQEEIQQKNQGWKDSRMERKEKHKQRPKREEMSEFPKEDLTCLKDQGASSKGQVPYWSPLLCFFIPFKHVVS